MKNNSRRPVGECAQSTKALFLAAENARSHMRIDASNDARAPPFFRCLYKCCHPTVVGVSKKSFPVPVQLRPVESIECRLTQRVVLDCRFECPSFDFVDFSKTKNLPSPG